MADSKYTVQDLQDNLAYLEETKRQIKQAIIDKGQSVSNKDTFRSYADKIGAIETGIDTSDATANTNDIVSGKTAYSNNEKLVGSMPNNGELNYIPSTEEQIIPAGYTSGGIISAAGLSVDSYNTCLTLTNSILGGTIPYIEPEYIQNQNTNQYIDTKIITTNNIEFEIKYNHINKLGMYETILGGQTSDGKGIFLMNTCDDSISRKSLRYNTTENKVNTTHTYFNEDVVVTLKDNIFTFTSDSGTQSFTVGNTSSFNSNYSLWIFALNNGGSLFGGALMKLYYLKIWDNGVLIRDYIPVKNVLNDNKICLYDKVENKFYYNAGSGEFIAGGVA